VYNSYIFPLSAQGLSTISWGFSQLTWVSTPQKVKKQQLSNNMVGEQE
jgi:hypothetical protein